ncbi:MAG: hypothetical protein DWQ05_09285 [Calditrichaeota bacterium]|nr:MAG: hypothetical protein DWQ05_09285 [Calditrichota bacterium]
MILNKHALIFIGCNSRFVYLSHEEKLKEVLSVIRFWTNYSLKIKCSSLNYLVAPDAAPFVAKTSETLGREISCIVLPSVNKFAESINNVLKTFGEGKKNSVFLLSNNCYFPQPDELSPAFQKINSEERSLFFLTGQKSDFGLYPRLVVSITGEPVGSVDKTVSGLSRALASFYASTEKGGEISAERALSLAIDFLGTKTSAKGLLHNLFDHLSSGEMLVRTDLEKYFTAKDRIIELVNGQKMTGAEIEKTSAVDLGVYVFSPQILQEAVQVLIEFNKSKSQPVFDLIGAVATLQRADVEVYKVKKPDSEENVVSQIYGKPESASHSETQVIYRSPDKKKQPTSFVLSEIAEKRLRTWLLEAYGMDKALIKEKFEYLGFIFELFFYHFGEGAISLGRAAAPVALLGRHLENFGGMINAAAISRECQVMTRATENDTIRIRCTAPALFPDTNIPISDILAVTGKDFTWQEFLQNKNLHAFIRSHQHPWMAYVFATLLRACTLNNSNRLSGIDILIANSLPGNAGFNILPSLVFALAEALIQQRENEFSDKQIYNFVCEVYAFLRLELPLREITTLACAKAGKILPIQFSPIAIAKHIQFPDACRLLFCHSGMTNVQENHSQNNLARLKENIHQSLKIIESKRAHPGLAINHIRDLLPKRMAVSVAEFYSLFEHVPEHLTDNLFLNKPLSDSNDNGEQTKTVAQIIPARNVLMYLIGEYCRCRELIVRLNMGDIEGAGRLLRIAHDGERVAVRKNGRLEKYRLHYTDDLLSDLQKIALQNPESVAIYEQSGAVQTSSPEIDELVDVLNSVHGVLGAHISGYGTAGGALALVEKSAVESCIEHIDKEYYQPRGFEKTVLASRPVSGCSGIKFSREELTE